MSAVTEPSYTLGQLAEQLGAECAGDESRVINGVATLGSATAGDISFLANARYRSQLEDTAAAAVILGREAASDFSGNALVCDDPYRTFARLTHLFDQSERVAPGVHPTAVVDSAASIGERCSIGANAIVASGVVLGDGVVIGVSAVVGEGCRIGARTQLMPRSTLYCGVVVGEDCVIHSGAVIGCDGFGYAPYQEESSDSGSDQRRIMGTHERLPNVGRRARVQESPKRGVEP